MTRKIFSIELETKNKRISRKFQKKNPITEITISKGDEFNNIFDATEERIIEPEHSQKKTSRLNYREQRDQKKQA